MKNIFKKSIWILFYLLIFSYLIFNSFHYLDADLGWHLKVGEEILRNQAVPSLDLYDFSLAGKEWIDHEWLLNLTSFTIYENLGYVVLNIFFALIVILTLLSNLFLLKKYYLKKDFQNSLSIRQTCLIMSAQLLGVMAMAPHLGVRMQEITLLFLSLLLIILADYQEKRLYSRLFFLLPLFYFWASAHAGFLIGLFILSLFWLYQVCRYVNQKFNVISSLNFGESFAGKNLMILFIFIMLSILSTLMTPYGLKLYLFLSEYSNTFYMKLIAEWLPAYYLPIQYKQLLYLAIATCALILYLVEKYFSWRKKEKSALDLWLLGLSIMFIILSFKSKRHFPLFFVSSFPFLILLGEKFLTYPPNFFDNIKNNRIIKIYLVAGLILTSLNLFFMTSFTNNPFNQQNYCDVFPCEASLFLEKNSDQKRLFNAYDWGGYLIWTNPDQKIFIDGRLPQYKFANHTLLEEYLEFFKEGKAEEMLDKYEINQVLYKKPVEPEVNAFEKKILAVTDKEKDQYFFQDYLKNSPDWKLVYEDKLCLIYDKVK